jgi:hypothetical protein
MDLGHFKLSRRRVATERQHGERGTTNPPGNGGFEWLQRHNSMLQQRERRCGASPVFGDEMIS